MPQRPRFASFPKVHRITLKLHRDTGNEEVPATHASRAQFCLYTRECLRVARPFFECPLNDSEVILGQVHALDKLYTHAPA